MVESFFKSLKTSIVGENRISDVGGFPLKANPKIATCFCAVFLWCAFKNFMICLLTYPGIASLMFLPIEGNFILYPRCFALYSNMYGSLERQYPPTPGLGCGIL